MVHMNTIFYNLIHLSSNEMVNLHSRGVSELLQEAINLQDHPEVSVTKAMKFLMLV